MSDNFTLSCCSTVDVPYQYLESRRIPVLFYTYVVEDVTYVDDMGRDPQALPRFYEMLAAGKLPQTSQINVAVHHQFFSTDMTQFRRTGRVSGAAAAIATVLNICPLMRLDNKGAIKAYDKVRGKHKAIEATVNAMEQHAQGGTEYDQRCWICHSQCPDLARQLADALGERFPHVKGPIRICNIGTIIGSHAGQGTVAVFFMGNERPHME